MERFRAAHPTVAAGAVEREEPDGPEKSWALERRWASGDDAQREVRIAVHVDAVDEDMLREAYEDNVDYEFEEDAHDGAHDDDDEWEAEWVAGAQGEWEADAYDEDAYEDDVDADDY